MSEDSVQLINDYFPGLNKEAQERFAILGELYNDWNEKINVISRKDMQHFYERHVLHSLAIARLKKFKAGDQVIDIGTGGGFPGIPLAIMFPEANFTLVDSIGKKIRVVSAIAEALKLINVNPVNSRVEALKIKADYIVSRATAPMNDLVKWSTQLTNYQPGNGYIVLKGGDLEEEFKAFPKAKIHSISQWFREPFFETKQVIFLPFSKK